MVNNIINCIFIELYVRDGCGAVFTTSGREVEKQSIHGATSSVMLLRLASIYIIIGVDNMYLPAYLFVEVIAYCFYVFLCGVKPTMNLLIFLDIKIRLQK